MVSKKLKNKIFLSTFLIIAFFVISPTSFAWDTCSGRCISPPESCTNPIPGDCFLSGVCCANSSVTGGGWDVYGLMEFNLPAGSLTGIIVNFFEWIIFIFGFIGIIGFIISGILYLISSGDDDLMARAKKSMWYSIIGVIVGLSGWVVIKAVANFLNGYDL